MNQRKTRCVYSSLTIVLLIVGCRSNAPAFLPNTGLSNESSVPARVHLARTEVLEYVLASRFANIPPPAAWQLDEQQTESEYRFRSGDWLMVIRAVDRDDQNQLAVIMNPVEQLSWTGYLTPEGRVVDTTYGR